jgi:hypothetical protein
MIGVSKPGYLKETGENSEKRVVRKRVNYIVHVMTSFTKSEIFGGGPADNKSA